MTTATSAPLGWIEIDNEEQVAWALAYMTKHGVTLSGAERYGRAPYHQFKTAYQKFSDLSPDARAVFELDKSMKNAWMQRKSRRKSRGRLPKSFVLTTTAAAALKTMADAQGIPMNHALQSLLANTDAFRRELEAIKRKEIKDAKEAYERRKPIGPTLLDHQKVTIEKKRLEKRVSVLEAMVDGLLVQKLKYKLAMVEQGMLPDNSELTDNHDRSRRAQSESRQDFADLMKNVDQEVLLRTQKPAKAND